MIYNLHALLVACASPSLDNAQNWAIEPILLGEGRMYGHGLPSLYETAWVSLEFDLSWTCLLVQSSSLCEESKRHRPIGALGWPLVVADPAKVKGSNMNCDDHDECHSFGSRVKESFFILIQHRIPSKRPSAPALKWATSQNMRFAVATCAEENCTVPWPTMSRRTALTNCLQYDVSRYAIPFIGPPNLHRKEASRQTLSKLPPAPAPAKAFQRRLQRSSQAAKDSWSWALHSRQCHGLQPRVAKQCQSNVPQISLAAFLWTL